MKKIIRRCFIILLILCFLTIPTACSRKLYPEDMRNILTDKKPLKVKTDKDKIYLSYDYLSISDVNKTIRTLISDYHYEITKKATKVDGVTTFSMVNTKKGKEIKKVKFTIYKNNKVKVEYFKES